MANLVEKFAKLDTIFRPLLYNFPEMTITRIYSPGRKYFIKMLTSQTNNTEQIPKEKETTLWDINFKCNIFNAAGMFKKAEGYYAIAAQGAGAFLAGTTTATPRKGNTKHCISHPFLPIPRSATAINWMGLPNEGHEVVAARIAKLERKAGCPIGVSIGADPDATSDKAISGIIHGLELYQKANADFIELNESCPNVAHEHGETNEFGIDQKLIQRLEMIQEKFLKKRTRNLPVILKFSNDTKPEQVKPLVTLLCQMGFDGVNFGNTSIQYDFARSFIIEKEQKKFDLFINKFGGGVSGKPLKELSLSLCKSAVATINEIKPASEFHVIRTGGIENANDLAASEKAGVSLNQWFSAYFDLFAKYGNKVYTEIMR